MVKRNIKAMEISTFILFTKCSVAQWRVKFKINISRYNYYQHNSLIQKWRNRLHFVEKVKIINVEHPKSDVANKLTQFRPLFQKKIPLKCFTR